ncbi:MAG: metal-dependent hydrolase [Candidatus Alcyoniella australis]|nr:metal-dependent hydrolase [Candidatus Alcyoniella australis]
MNPVSHFLIGWVTANTVELTRRDRALIVIAGVAPDLDGLGIVAEKATQHSEQPLLWWTQYHHVLCHNLGFGLLLTALALVLAKTRRAITALLALLAFHLHLLGDLVGARGPEGDQWPIPYLLPFSDKWELAWSHQWALNAWPNFAITAAMLAATFYLAAKRGYSPLEFVSQKADKKFVETLRKRFGENWPSG